MRKVIVVNVLYMTLEKSELARETRDFWPKSGSDLRKRLPAKRGKPGPFRGKIHFHGPQQSAPGRKLAPPTVAQPVPLPKGDDTPI